MRPLGITVVSTLYMAGAVVSAAGLAYRFEGAATWDKGLPMAGYAFLIFLSAVAGAGLWNLRNWARRLTLIVSATHIAVGVILLLLLSSHGWLTRDFVPVAAIGVGLNYIVLLYLRNDSVRAVFSPAV